MFVFLFVLIATITQIKSHGNVAPSAVPYSPQKEIETQIQPSASDPSLKAQKQQQQQQQLAEAEPPQPEKKI